MKNLGAALALWEHVVVVSMVMIKSLGTIWVIALALVLQGVVGVHGSAPCCCSVDGARALAVAQGVAVDEEAPGSCCGGGAGGCHTGDGTTDEQSGDGEPSDEHKCPGDGDCDCTMPCCSGVVKVPVAVTGFAGFGVGERLACDRVELDEAPLLGRGLNGLRRPPRVVCIV